MKRRQFIQYTGASLITAGSTITLSELKAVQAQSKPSNSLLIQWLGHTCYLFSGGGLRILVNPFRTIGCTVGYRLPKVEADLVLISSQLWDEGAAENLPGNPKILYEAGAYEIQGFKIQGISIAHDREGGRRFGTNVAWRWVQSDLRILHLGGAAAPIALEQKILMGSPDVALIPVGGGAKAYNPEEAKQAMLALKPRIMIPMQYLTPAADKSLCDLVAVDEFLNLVKDMNIRKLNNNEIRIKKSDLPKEGTLIRVLSESKLLKQSSETTKPPESQLTNTQVNN